MLSRDLAREDAPVVAVPVHAAGVARHAVLAETGRCLVDRSAEVDARDRRALPVRGLCGQLVPADGRHAELGQIQDRAREPGRRDHILDLEDELGRAVGFARVHAERLAGPFDALDRCVEDDDSAGENVVLVRLHVSRADSDERTSVDRELRGGRRREDDLPGPLQEPGRELEARMLLADDEDAPSGVGLGGARLRVVWHVLDAGYLRTPGLRDADREDGDLAAILAVTRLEHPAIAVAPRSGPAAAVAHRNAGAGGEGLEVPLHLGPGWVVRSAVHHLAHQRAAVLLFGQKAVPVVALVLAGPLLEGRIGLCPRKQALEEGPLAEHPARALIGRNDRVLHTEDAERVADLETPGTAADDNDRILAGRVGLVGQAPLRVTFASFRASATRRR